MYRMVIDDIYDSFHVMEMKNNFGILEPVLYRQSKKQPWTADFFVREGMLLGARLITKYSEIIPLKGNEELANTTLDYEKKDN